MHNQKLRNNPLKTKSDLTEALLELLRPLENSFGQWGMYYSTGEAQYGQKIGEIEALLRPLWGIVPLIAGGGQYVVLDKYLAKVADGVNPESPSYWGRLGGGCQRMVEMAALAMGILLAKQRFWDALPSADQDNLYNWLNQINDHPIHAGNWVFFRILTNTAFAVCGREYNQKRLDEDLAVVNSIYDSGGWYFDGSPNHRDYYIPFAIHFYGLVYAEYAFFDEKNPKVFRERAANFAKDFPVYFADDGAAVPHGRSMAYRFAQGAFWGALVFADIEALPWGQIKHLALQHLRHWFAQDIFTDKGELTIGYYYPNQVMAEAYNSFGSPYWAAKAFILLAVSDDHPFWQADEEKPAVPASRFISQSMGIFQRDKHQVQYFTVGQKVAPWMSLSQPKYEKFVYSTYFGFSVPKAAVGLSQGAFDNTLAVSEQDEFYRMRYGVENYEINEGFLYSKWLPWPDVCIESYIVPLMPWHVRLHIVGTGRRIALADGGFAISRDGDYERRIEDDKLECAIIRDESVSAVVSLLGSQKPELVWAEPNTNVIVPRTIIPTLTAKVDPGQYVFASAILGAYGDNCTQHINSPPTIETTTDGYTISHGGKQIRINPKQED